MKKRVCESNECENKQEGHHVDMQGADKLHLLWESPTFNTSHPHSVGPAARQKHTRVFPRFIRLQNEQQCRTVSALQLRFKL